VAVEVVSGSEDAGADEDGSEIWAEDENVPEAVGGKDVEWLASEAEPDEARNGKVAEGEDELEGDEPPVWEEVAGEVVVVGDPESGEVVAGGGEDVVEGGCVVGEFVVGELVVGELVVEGGATVFDGVGVGVGSV
jgi:hypothetical protein